MVERDKNLNVRVSGDELRMLAALAENDGISSSDWLRVAIRRAFAETFGPPKPSKRPRPKRGTR